ncbi:MAG: succinate dehydrogenase iron-sulfur subunit [Armatimonadota bacterium]|nr:succinate dehydrogenase iron-sulfur subunit [Armatimonadota bacterium]MDR7440389.1 succinate dehydrogenase iron-sulfur subunit [Armatimonadota bacterium]MDR7443429.1 succinate dehydrogenase iron-sulfur subunit [Armatimonadota bacterium]MDR7569268.1 succinate dehydrogenase iron-sulfur subunit [Armatimonadota bacterium]MDR7614928.1 succinate dehydrogenase iron-sulfur subunit [Armatimonadota bacterium]
MKATIRIKRFNPEVDRRPYWAEYEVPVDPFDRVLDALHYIKANLDGSLALRRSCAHGICGSDAMLINGRNRLACKVLIKDLGPRITVEPLRGLRVIKDLVVDMEPFFEKYRQVMPWLITDEPPPPQERRQTPEERARYEDTTKCILCAVCTTACPIFWGTGEFLGPAALVAAHRFIFDSRDQAAQQRLQILADRSGVFKCRTVFNCTEACPQGIEITKAIQELKQAIILSRT